MKPFAELVNCANMSLTVTLCKNFTIYFITFSKNDYTVIVVLNKTASQQKPVNEISYPSFLCGITTKF